MHVNTRYRNSTGHTPPPKGCTFLHGTETPLEVHPPQKDAGFYMVQKLHQRYTPLKRMHVSTWYRNSTGGTPPPKGCVFLHGTETPPEVHPPQKDACFYMVQKLHRRYTPAKKMHVSTWYRNSTGGTPPKKRMQVSTWYRNSTRGTPPPPPPTKDACFYMVQKLHRRYPPSPKRMRVSTWYRNSTGGTPLPKGCMFLHGTETPPEVHPPQKDARFYMVQKLHRRYTSAKRMHVSTWYRNSTGGTPPPKGCRFLHGTETPPKVHPPQKDACFYMVQKLHWRYTPAKRMRVSTWYRNSTGGTSPSKGCVFLHGTETPPEVHPPQKDACFYMVQKLHRRYTPAKKMHVSTWYRNSTGGTPPKKRMQVSTWYRNSTRGTPPPPPPHKGCLFLHGTETPPEVPPLPQKDACFYMVQKLHWRYTPPKRMQVSTWYRNSTGGTPPLKRMHVSTWYRNSTGGTPPPKGCRFLHGTETPPKVHPPSKGCMFLHGTETPLEVHPRQKDACFYMVQKLHRRYIPLKRMRVSTWYRNSTGGTSPSKGCVFLHGTETPPEVHPRQKDARFYMVQKLHWRYTPQKKDAGFYMVQKLHQRYTPPPPPPQRMPVSTWYRNSTGGTPPPPKGCVFLHGTETPPEVHPCQKDACFYMVQKLHRRYTPPKRMRVSTWYRNSTGGTPPPKECMFLHGTETPPEVHPPKRMRVSTWYRNSIGGTPPPPPPKGCVFQHGTETPPEVHPPPPPPPKDARF